MKSGLLSKWVLGLGVCMVGVSAGCLDKSSSPPVVQTVAATEAVPDVAAQSSVNETPAPSPAPAVENPTPVAEEVTAPAQPVVMEKTTPANVRLSAPAMEIVKLANSGVEEGVMLSYVTNSTSTFNLGANEIIYLNDIGVPGTVVSAMIQHDQALNLAAANAAAAAAQPAPTAPAPGYPPPAEVAPQPEESAAVYPPLTPPASEVTYQDFYSGLSPYGTWIDIAGYGRCWQPTVVVANPYWQPYFDCGSWAYTDCGWYWHSGYSWGWAPFHYGRWFRHAGFGWCWTPDTVWGPSWVCWRDSGAYCGWAPLPPGCGFTVGIGYTFHGRRIHDFDECGLGPRHYRFVGWSDFHDRNLRGRELRQRDATDAFNRTTVVNRMVLKNNTVINQGIAPERVANATQRDIRQVALADRRTRRPQVGPAAPQEARARTLAVYRPERTPSGLATGTAADRSGVPVRQGFSQSVPSAASAPSAAPAPRVTGQPGTFATRAPLRLNEPKDESRPATLPGRAPEVTRAPAATFAQETVAPRADPAPGSARAVPPAARAAPSPARPQATPLAPQRFTPTTRQPTTPPATVSTPRAPYTRPASPQPSTPAPTRTPVPQVSRATPWLDSRPATPAPAPAPASAPAARQYTAPAPRQNTAPIYVPQRTYTPPAAPVQRAAPSQSWSAPSRPAVTEVPRYTPSPAPSRPAVSEAPRYAPPAASAPQSSAAQTRSAPSAPPPSVNRGSSAGNRAGR